MGIADTCLTVTTSKTCLPQIHINCGPGVPVGLRNKCRTKSEVISKPGITMIIAVGFKNAGLIGKQLASSVFGKASMRTLEYRVKVSSQEAMSCTRRRVGWLFTDLGRIITERSASIDSVKQSSGSNSLGERLMHINKLTPYNTVLYATWHHRERRQRQLVWSCQGTRIHARSHWW